MLKQISNWLFWLQYPPEDPDELRYKNALSRLAVLMAGLGALVSAGAHAQYRSSGRQWVGVGTWEVYVIGLVMFFLLVWFWFINRRTKADTRLLGIVMLLLLTAAAAWSDTAGEVAHGRGAFTLCIPVIIAPLFLPSRSAFTAAVLSTLAMATRSYAAGLFPSYPNMLLFYVAAFGSWLTASTLEGALRVSRAEAEKNTVILNGVADGIVVVDTNGKLTSANPAALSILGDDLADAVTQITAERAEYKGRILELNWAIVRSVGRVAVIRDITRAVEVDRAKDALLGSVSHELRTPLTAIAGFAEVIEVIARRAGCETENIVSYAGRIRKNVNRLKSLVNSLLDHAQIQAGAFKLLWQDVSLREVAQDVDELMSGMASEKGLAFRSELDELTPRMVRGDKERLEQILVNLIGNAIKFTEAGSVSIRIYPLTDERWGFSVLDTGSGISPAQLPDVFLPFRRGADYATRTRQGAGLGLSISKSLVEMMGGEIGLRSEVGQGTTIWAAFPVRPSVQKSPAGKE